MAEAVAWREAMRQALYGPEGFFTRTNRPGATGHFRTSAHASPLFATAILRLLVGVDEALGRPSPLDVVDIGAGQGHLLRRLAVLAPTYLARRLRLTAVELASRPADLPAAITWRADLPAPGSVQGLILATEWLDNVPQDIAEVDPAGRPRQVLVDPLTGAEELGDPVSGEAATWAARWWSHQPLQPGMRIELGGTRDAAWARAVTGLARGLAVTVDYGHMWYARPRLGTLAGFYAGRSAQPIPDGSRDVTTHVAIDAACAAGEAAAGRSAVLTTQREVLQALGVDATRPPQSLASTDPAGYMRALTAASQAGELTDPTGLGGHYWILQPVGVDGADVLPAGLRSML